MRSASNTMGMFSRVWGKGEKTYTWTSRTVRVALGSRGDVKSEKAIKPATQKATVVKKPKTFCPRTRVECMVVCSPFGLKKTVFANARSFITCVYHLADSCEMIGEVERVVLKSDIWTEFLS